MDCRGILEGSGSISIEDYTEKLFQDLVGLGIVEQPPQTITTFESDMRMASFGVIPLFLQYIMTRETEEIFFVPLEVTALEEGCDFKTERVGQHLAIRSSWKRDEIVLQSLDLSRLRSLTVSGEWLPRLMINNRMRVLRVLDLVGTSNLMDEDLKEIGEFLSRLKFLSLRGCKDITRLPASIRYLGLLQTLDIRETSVVKLPRSIIKLRKLQYIRAGLIPAEVEELPAPSRIAEGEQASPASRAEEQSPTAYIAGEEVPTPARSSEGEQSPPASNAEEQPPTAFSAEEELPPSPTRSSQVGACRAGIKVPAGVTKLMALHTLGVANVNTAAGRDILEELKKLTQLRKLGLFSINRANSRHLRLASSNLESLSLHFQNVHIDDIELPKKLRSLKLYGHAEQMPRSIKDLHALMKLSLEVNTLNQRDIEALGRLEKLYTLRLRVNNVLDDKLQFCDSHFLRLHILNIASTTRFDVMFSEGSLAELELLEVHCSRPVAQVFGQHSLSGCEARE